VDKIKLIDDIEKSSKETTRLFIWYNIFY
jgi:hypothetical protein